jgi:hypothetical protein
MDSEFFFRRNGCDRDEHVRVLSVIVDIRERIDTMKEESVITDAEYTQVINRYNTVYSLMVEGELFDTDVLDDALRVFTHFFNDHLKSRNFYWSVLSDRLDLFAEVHIRGYLPRVVTEYYDRRVELYCPNDELHKVGTGKPLSKMDGVLSRWLIVSALDIMKHIDSSGRGDFIIRNPDVNAISLVKHLRFQVRGYAFPLDHDEFENRCVEAENLIHAITDDIEVGDTGELLLNETVVTSMNQLDELFVYFTAVCSDLCQFVIKNAPVIETHES